MAEHCFTYGSLMCADIMRRVTGATFAAEPARLPGFRSLAVRGEDYPGLVESPGGLVAGMLYRDLPAPAWARLDSFEGEMYERIRVEVELAGGQCLSAWAYLFGAPFRDRLDTAEWDFQHFLAVGKARFEAHYLGFREIDGEGGRSAEGYP